MIVDLPEQEWQQVMACMSYAPGRECIGLLNKIGAQLQMQRLPIRGDGKEVEHEPTHADAASGRTN